MKKTNIQMLLRINYPRFAEYLEWLLDRQLVMKASDMEDGEGIGLTPKGVDSYHRLVDWIREMMEGIKL